MEPVVDENNHSVQNSGSAASTDNGEEGSEYEYYSQTAEGDQAGQAKDAQEYGAEEDEEYDDEYDDEDDQQPV